ncbi:MAG: hypothetical protein ACWGOD_00935 [Desulfobulbales bacterium]
MVALSFPGRDKRRVIEPLSFLVAILPLKTKVEIFLGYQYLHGLPGLLISRYRLDFCVADRQEAEDRKLVYRRALFVFD